VNWKGCGRGCRGLVCATGPAIVTANLGEPVFDTRTARPCVTMRDRSKMRLKCDGTRAETRFRLSEKRTHPFKSAGASVQSTTGNRGVHISGSNAGYTMFRDSAKSTTYPLHSPVSPSLPLPCVTMCHHISTRFYQNRIRACGLSVAVLVRNVTRNIHHAMTHLLKSSHRKLSLCTPWRHKEQLMDEGVSFTSRPLYPGIHSKGRWVSPRPRKDVSVKRQLSLPFRESKPGSVNL
jgi:hypothetical protein